VYRIIDGGAGIVIEDVDIDIDVQYIDKIIGAI